MSEMSFKENAIFDPESLMPESLVFCGNKNNFVSCLNALSDPQNEITGGSNQPELLSDILNQVTSFDSENRFSGDGLEESASSAQACSNGSANSSSVSMDDTTFCSTDGLKSIANLVSVIEQNGSTGSNLKLENKATSSTGENVHEGTMLKEAMKSLYGYCEKPEILLQMIRNLKKDIEKNCALIKMLKSMAKAQCRTDTSTGHCANCNMNMHSAVQNHIGKTMSQYPAKVFQNKHDLCQASPPKGNQMKLDLNKICTKNSDDLSTFEFLNNTATENSTKSDKSDNRQKPICRNGTFETPKTDLASKLVEKNFSKSYSCGSCDFKTSHLKGLHGHLLSKHKVRVPGFKIYSCKFCDYTCVDKQRLQEHEPRHTGIKQFTCAECSKGFATKRGLRTHLKFHSEERPHTCTMCDASFKVRSKLNDHIRLVHTNKGEKPYQCGYCHHRASVRGNVNQHIRKAHKGKPVIVRVVKTSS